MVNANAALQLFQWGREVTKGTPVPATSQIACVGIDFDSEDELARPMWARGYVMRTPGTETPHTRGITFRVPPSPLVFDQFQHWLAMGVQGGLLPAAPVDGASTWVAQRALTTVPVLDSFTIERRITPGALPKDGRSSYAMVSNITLKGQPNSEVTMEATGFARRRKASVLTPALAPNPGIFPVFARSEVFIDPTFATVGTTPFIPQILDWSLSIDTGVKPLYAATNNADLDFDLHVLDGRVTGFEFEATVLVDSLFSLEQQQSELIDGSGSAGFRAIRLRINSPLLIGVTASRKLDIDMTARQEKATVVSQGERDGQNIAVLRWRESPDGVNPWLRATLINGTGLYT